MMGDCHGNNCSHATNSLYTQSLDEIDFEKGIWQACMDGNNTRVEKLLKKGVDINIRDSSGYTGLHYAARNGRYDTVKLLLNNDADVNCVTKSGLETPLHRASFMGHIEIIKLLCEKNANVLLQNVDGQTCLHKAVAQDHKQVADYLLSHNSNLKTIQDKKNKTAFDYDHL